MESNDAFILAVRCIYRTLIHGSGCTDYLLTP